jgi:putative radical SAM enzyme (TIGR03279 family)
LAQRIGLRAGDVLLSINGHLLRDVVDVGFYAAEERLTFEFQRDDRTLVIEAQREYNQPLGLDFRELTFDGVRRCDNHCAFCFVAQMPPHLRAALYIKDDDYRYSFLTGSYVTLTNLTDADWKRIAAQYLSPLYVSVHATDFALRRRILHNPNAPDIIEQLRRLAAMGIKVHTQIVVVPGLNDGPHLERSLLDLAELYPMVRSVSIVPVGLTRFHRGGCRVHTTAEVRLVLDQMTAWQARLRERLGVAFAYLSDEWYLRLGEDVPKVEDYDDVDLTENGVGLVSRFKADQDWQSALGTLKSPTLVTGVLFAPILRACTEADVIPVVNVFFGETVTVAGLLTGQDVVAQLREKELGDVIVLPSTMFGGPGGQSLDGMVPQEIGEALGRKVILSCELVS